MQVKQEPVASLAAEATIEISSQDGTPTTVKRKKPGKVNALRLAYNDVFLGHELQLEKRY